MNAFLHNDALLPAYFDRGIKCLFIETAPRPDWVEAGHYFSNPGNRFLEYLAMSGITPVLLKSNQDARLLKYRLGLTALSRTVMVNKPEDLNPVDSSPGAIIKATFTCRPDIVCFHGRVPFEKFFDLPGEFGRKNLHIGPATVYVLPDSSESKTQISHHKKLEYYRNLATLISEH